MKIKKDHQDQIERSIRCAHSSQFCSQSVWKSDVIKFLTRAPTGSQDPWILFPYPSQSSSPSAGQLSCEFRAFEFRRANQPFVPLANGHEPDSSLALSTHGYKTPSIWIMFGSCTYVRMMTLHDCNEDIAKSFLTLKYRPFFFSILKLFFTINGSPSISSTFFKLTSIFDFPQAFGPLHAARLLVAYCDQGND